MADIRSIIIDAANRYGVDQDFALKTAQIESGLDPHAQAKGSTAGGLFQFIDGTWGKYGKGESKFDAYASADAFMRLTRDNQNYLKGKLGRDLTKGEMYLAHQQGAGGALNLLANPNAMAVDLVGRAAVLGNAGKAGMTASEFASLWTRKMDGTMPGSAPASVSMPGSMANSQNPGDFSVHDQGRVSASDVIPTMNTTRAESVQQEKDRRAMMPSYGEAVATAVKNEWSVLTPFRALGHYDPEPNYKLTEDKLKALGQNIPDAYLSEFEDAVSDEHAQAIRDRLMTQLEDNQKIASLGTAGMIISMGAALTDPGAIAATAAIGAISGGFGVPAAVASRLGRVGLVGLGMAEGVAGNLATDIPLAAVDPTRNVSFDDLKYSIGTGLVMGGVMGGFRRNPMFNEEAKQIAKIGQQMQQEASAPVISSGTVHERIANELAFSSGPQPFELNLASLPSGPAEVAIAVEKLTNYLLNPTHKDGGPKAGFFRQELGIEQKDWRYLHAQLSTAIQRATFQNVRVETHGIKVEADIAIVGLNGKVAVVRTAWIIRQGERVSLVTALPGPAEHPDRQLAAASPIVGGNLPDNERWKRIYSLASQAGEIAAEKIIPTPMRLAGYPVILEGMCGFGYVRVLDALKGFGRWLLREGHAARGTKRGATIFFSSPTQSVDRAGAEAKAFAEVLQMNEIVCEYYTVLD